MLSKITINNNSIGPIGLMWVLLVAFKLMAVIDWSWWIVVFFPLIAGLGVVATFTAIACLCGGVVWLACRE